jgi:hypothetical protein
LTHSFNHRHIATFQLDKNRNFTAEREVRKLNYRGRKDCRNTRINSIATVL